jgi:hypothetical protein
MTKPHLWGPAMWQALFASARQASTPAEEAALRALLLVQLPLLIPCLKCREHFRERRGVVARRAHGEPRTGAHAVRWLYYLKDEVNKTLHLERTSAQYPRTRSGTASPLTLAELEERGAFHRNEVDDVRIADMLVLVALSARERELDDLFVEMCHAFGRLLPIAEDGRLRLHLKFMQRPIVPNAVSSARATRKERGLRRLSERHYRDHAEPEEIPA